MKLLKEIRRRTRNAARALRGEEYIPPLVEIPVKTEQVKVETFCVEQTLPGSATAYAGGEKIKARYCEAIAREIGEGLLRSGFIKFEVINPLGPAGYDVSWIKARVRVVRPEKEGAAV